jgi:DNA polymerase-3 subunit gamma/tau
MAKKKAAAETPLPLTGTTDYTVLARRYRPQQFGDLVGQEPVAQALVNALKSNRVAHAYLFTGARGVGKTSTARILAKALNCTSGPTTTPCDQCESCRAIAVGEDMDVLEIDGASNNKVEEVRELRQNVQYKPNRSRFKIYIIDEVHMLSTSAFNALLKTLEEPPPHVKFIFATTEVQKIPVTILSRCQRFDFVSISGKRIQERLQGILDEEKAAAEPGVLDVIARRAGGSMRDAQSLLDQLVAFGGDKLTLQTVNQLLGTADEEQVVALGSAILQHDPAKALELLATALDAGTQLGELLDQLVDYWRDLMLLCSAGTKVEGLTFSARHREAMHEQSGAISLDTILAGLDMLAATKARLRGTSHGRVLLEMAVVRLARLDDLLPLSELARQLANGVASARPAAARGPSPSTPAAEPAGVKKKSSDNGQATPSASPQALAAPLRLTAESLAEVWACVLGKLGHMHRLDLEKAGLPAISGPNCLVLHFPANYNSEREHCEDSGRAAPLEKALAEVTGQTIAIRYGAQVGGEVAPPKVARNEQLRRSAIQEPLVQAVMNHLAGNLVKADDGFGAGTAPHNTDTEERE